MQSNFKIILMVFLSGLVRINYSLVFRSANIFKLHERRVLVIKLTILQNTVFKRFGCYLFFEFQIRCSHKIYNNTFKCLGFIFRHSNLFKYIFQYVYLFTSLVPPFLEYNSVVKNP